MPSTIEAFVEEMSMARKQITAKFVGQMLSYAIDYSNAPEEVIMEIIFLDDLGHKLKVVSTIEII